MFPKLKERFTIFLIIFFCLLSSIVAAQTNQFHYFHTFSIKDGLTQSTVYAILRDNKGFLWIGTGSGLSRFNGQQTTRYFASANDLETTPGNRVSFITDDAEGNVWISTSGGLVRFEDSNNNFERQEINNTPIMADAFYILSDGLFFTTSDAFYKYDYQSKSWQILPVISDKEIDLFFTTILRLSNNKFLLSARHKGLFIYDINTGEINEAAFYDGKKDINKIYLDKQNRIWVAPYGEGLMCYSQTGQLLKIYNTENSGLNNNVVLDVIEHNGSLWIATDGGGINILNTATNYFSHIQPVSQRVTSFPASAIISLYKDKWDNLWVGSIRNGLIEVKSVFMNTFQQTNFGNSYGLSYATVISLFQENDETFWVGTDGGGINRFNPKNGRFEHFQSSMGDKVTSIVKHTSDELLISVFGQGVFYFNKKTGQKRRLVIVNEEEDYRILKSGYSATLQTDDGVRYLILSDSLYEYNSRNNSFSIIPVEKDEAERGHVLRQVTSDVHCRYLFTTNTLYSKTENEGWKKFVTLPSEEIIETVALDNNGVLWVGTNNGLKYINPLTDTTAQTIPLPFKNTVNALVCDSQDRLWMGANGTLWVYYINDNHFEQFDASSGALPNEYMARPSMVSSDGNIYMGGVNGLLLIDKDIPPLETTQPALQLIEVVSNDNLRQTIYNAGENMEEPPHLKLAWNKSSVTLQIMVQEKDIFRKRSFLYYISGLSGGPIETDNQFLTLQTLPSGDYTVSVSCNLVNGEWSEPQNILHLSILPPWWKSTWFIILEVIIALTAIVLAVLWYIRKKENAHKWQLITQKQEINEEKLRFLTNISHELRTPLTLIYAPLKRLVNQLTEKETFKSEITGVYKQAARMKETIDMVLDMRKIDSRNEELNIELHPLHEWIVDTTTYFIDEMKHNEMKLNYDFDENIDKVAFDRRQCTIVLSNFLSNAMKFGKPFGTITIKTKLYETQNYFRISVSDEGRGLSESDIEKLFTRFYQGKHELGGSGIGLAFSKKLIEMHKGGKIGAHNNSDGIGATFYFELPVDQHMLNINSQDKQPDEKEVNSSRSKYAALPRLDTSNLSLLVVEDSPDLLIFLKESFSKTFQTVLTASNGEDALGIIRSLKPDIILSDVVMPRMDGFDLCRIIKSDISISHIPVVLLTSRTDSENMLLGYKLGADAYVAKPFDIDFLQVILENQLNIRERIKAQYKSQSDFMQPQDITFSNADEHFILKLNSLIETHLDDSYLNVTFIASQMGMSRASLYNKMKELLNIGVNDYINRIKLEKAAVLLTSNPDLEIAEVAARFGFSSQRYFSTSFKQYKGVSPSEYRKRM